MPELPALEQSLIDEFVGVCHGDLERVKTLLAAHPGLVHGNASWVETGIQAAAQTGRVDIVEYLLAAGAALDICTAAMLGQRDQVAAFLQKDPGQSQARGAHGIPVMYFPAIRGHQEIAALLLDNGADINAGAGGNTALHGAVLFGQVEMVRWLLEHTANPGLLDYNGKTALELARGNGQTAIAELLESL
jgi:ankyrin repeat protein